MQTLASKGILPGRDFTYFYVDVEDCDPDDDCWLDFATNQQYVLDVVAGLQAGGASVGLCLFKLVACVYDFYGCRHIRVALRMAATDGVEHVEERGVSFLASLVP